MVNTFLRNLYLEACGRDYKTVTSHVNDNSVMFEQLSVGPQCDGGRAKKILLANHYNFVMIGRLGREPRPFSAVCEVEMPQPVVERAAATLPARSASTENELRIDAAQRLRVDAGASPPASWRGPPGPHKYEATTNSCMIGDLWFTPNNGETSKRKRLVALHEAVGPITKLL